MSKSSPPETYIPEAAAPVITKSVTPQRDYQYAADYLDKLEAERRAIEQKTWNELSDVYRQETAKEDQYYLDSLAKDEPDYTAGLDPYQLNTIASQVYGGGAAAALEDLRNRRSREYVAVAGANPMGRPPAPAAPIPVSLPEIPANLFTPSPRPAPAPKAPSRMSLSEISDKYGQFSTFGHRDYQAAKQQGYSDAEIKNYLDADISRLHPDNRPGGSAGLYDEIKRGNVDLSKAVNIVR